MSMLPSVDRVERRARRALDRADYDRFQPMVRRTAMRLARRLPPHIAVADLVSCGWVGLMDAYSRAAPDMQPEEFEAYAAYRVRGAMLDYLRGLDSVSREMRRTSRRLTRAIKDLTGELGRPPTEDEIARALGLTAAQYLDTLSKIARAGMTRLELLDLDAVDLEADEVPADDSAQRKELCAAVADAIEGLPTRLRHVLALYYQEECTLRQIGEVLGVSESRASQLHTEAIHRLRAAIGRE